MGLPLQIVLLVPIEVAFIPLKAKLNINIEVTQTVEIHRVFLSSSLTLTFIMEII